jgi:hypothetical protein
LQSSRRSLCELGPFCERRSSPPGQPLSPSLDFPLLETYELKLRKSSMDNFDRKYRVYLTMRRSVGSCRVGSPFLYNSFVSFVSVIVRLYFLARHAHFVRASIPRLRKSSMDNFDRKYRVYLTMRRSVGSCRVG